MDTNGKIKRGMERKLRTFLANFHTQDFFREYDRISLRTIVVSTPNQTNLHAWLLESQWQRTDRNAISIFANLFFNIVTN